MKIRAAASMLVIVAGAVVAVRAEEKATSGAAQQFAALKTLAGDWVEVKDGKPTDKVVSSIRVTAGGNTVQETHFPGTEHEMVTMYHLDGKDLILTHYCMLGNQPRLRAEPSDDANKIAFKFVSAGNLKSADEHHMHEATLIIDGKDRYKAVWASNKDGKTCHEAKFELVRKAK